MPELDEIYATNSSTWWNENGPLKLIHVTNDIVVPYYLDVICQRFSKTSPINVKLLDVGCGGGLCTEKFGEAGYSVIGIDINPDLINIAKNHLHSSLRNVSYYTESIETHAENNAEKYDVVVINFVIQHLTDHEVFVRNCVECLKPGGTVLIGALGKNTGAWLMRKIYIEKMLKLFPPGLYDYNRCINASDLESMLKKYKCKTQETRGFFYNFLTGKFGWFPSSMGYYVLYAIKKD
ncbi:hypothetical protein RN001_000685 [Aquatica leii]|uniref:Methyltransferase type 11 domain-containing protein n=1 Tax=Aquatica leii TaxID=1421715 RepID=A0AAN7SKR5_9COLE|nr:hypothetical protein RN001_000685 [Aquatica leii]